MKISKRFTVFSWSMYDFANTIFAMNVISLYFALWVTVDMKGEDILYSWALSGSMLLVALTAPVLGTISDIIGRRMPFLVVFTAICCVFTAFIGFVDELILGLLFFAIANYFYQTATIFYNALLPQISTKEKIGRVSGYGVALGYCGTIVGLLLARPFVLKYGNQATFVPTAIAFLVFSIPCFLFVKEKLVKKIYEPHPFLVSFEKVKDTLTHLKETPGIYYFLIAAFVSLNAVNTVTIFMSIYIKKVIGFTDAEIITFYVVSTVFAIINAFISGFITDKFGAKRTLSVVLVLWGVSLFLAVVSFNKTMFWIVGPLVGISLGASWTSARALAIELAPPQMVGEIFGLYSLVGKSASIVGPMVWGLSVLTFGFLGVFKYRLAIFILLIFLAIGFVILQKIPDKEKELT